jgi:uncharacterized protein
MSTNVETALGKFVWHDHTSSDVDKAKSFYTELLGWELETWDPDGMNYSMIKQNGRNHGGFGESQGGAPPYWLGHVAVDSVDETAGKAKAGGGRILAEPFDVPDVGRIVVFADPQGAVISAFEGTGTPENPPAEGVFVWDELHTSDVDAAKTFYGDVFGWSARDMDMGTMTYTMFERAGGGDAAGCAPLEGVQAPPHWLAYLGTDDVDASTARAKELGATVFVEPADIPGVGRFSVLQDPAGATFALFKPSAEM